MRNQGVFKLAVWAGVCAFVLAQAAGAAELKEYKDTKHGYKLKIPAQFQVQDEGLTTTWIYQPGSAPADTGKKKGGGLLKNLAKNAIPGAGAADAAAGGGELQPALTIYVNWVWMPDVDSGTMYSTNKKSDQQNIDSPDPQYKDIVDFDKKKGYAHDGNTYWYKEIDKSDPTEIHRWHIKSYGNKSAYTVGLCGTYEQFKEWGPIYEEVIKSWELIPIKE